jgi:disulfide oxidoreductase YuzD
MSQSIGYVHLTVGYLHMYISIAKEHMKSKTSKILEMMEMEQYIYNYIYISDLGMVWYGTTRTTAVAVASCIAQS